MAGQRPGRRAAKRRLPKPYRQGDLDGLCGLYSTINAIRVLCPELDHGNHVWLFSRLLHELPKLGARLEVVATDGIGRGQLAKLIRRAAADVADEFDIGLRVTRVPKTLRRTADLKTFWAWLGRHLSPTSVAVVGLDGRMSHWTVAVKVTGQQVRIFDSGDMGAIRRRSCTVGRAASRFSISPVTVFVIARREP